MVWKKRHLGVLSIVVLFVITHAFAFLQWQQMTTVTDLWRSGAYGTHQSFVEKASRSGSQRKQFAQGLVAHETKKFEEAVVYRQAIIDEGCKGTALCPQTYRNRGDSLAEIGITMAQPQEKIDYRQQAIAHYDSSLSLVENEQTRHNKAVVQGRIDELQPEEQEDNEAEQEGQEESQGENNEGEQENEGEGQQQQQSQREDSALSDYQKQQLEQYQEQLEEQQTANQQYFEPMGEQQEQLSPFDQFFGGQLQRQLPNTQGSKDR